MIFRSVQLRDFGPFEELQFDLNQPVTVILGDNESGKTSLMEWMTGILYGFSRQKQLRGGLIRWGAKEAVLCAQISLEGGETLTVTRRIRETGASCLLETDRGAEELGDAPLPQLRGLDRSLYTGVYSLRLEDLHFPDTSVWTALQQRLLSGEILSFLRPVSEVSAQWRSQALNLWRPDRRGMPKLQSAYARRDELFRQLEDARLRQEALEKLAEEEAALKQQLGQDAKVRREEEAFLKEAQEKRELLSQLDRYERLLQEAGDLTPFRDLPLDLETRRAQLEKDIRETETTLLEAEKQRTQLLQTRTAYTEEDRALLAHSEAIRVLSGRRSQIAGDREALLLQEAETGIAAAQYKSLAKTVLVDPAAPEDALSRISLAKLQDEARRFSDLQSSVDELESDLQTLRMETARSRTPLWGTLPAALMFLYGISIFLYPDVFPFAIPGTGLSILAGGLTAAGALLAALCIGFALPRKKALLEILEQEYRDSLREEAGAKERLQKALEGVQVPDSLLDNPLELLRQLDLLESRLETRKAAERRLKEIKDRLSQSSLEASRLANLLLREPPLDTPAAVDALSQAYEAAKSRRDAAQATAAGLKTLEERIHRLQDLKTIATQNLLQFQSALMQAGGFGIREEIDNLNRRRAFWDRAQTLRDDVRERTGHDLSTLRADITRNGWPWHDEAVQLSELTCVEIRDREQKALSRLGALGQERQNLLAQKLPADIRAELKTLDEDIAQLTRERDQVALAFGLLRLGEEKYRREHQPELIRRAGEYLSVITGGKYSRMMLSPDQDALWIYQERMGVYLDPMEKRLSKGTLEQIYLSLRLAMLDQLDPAGIPLPLVLDETLVDWDDRRLRSALSVLRQVSRKRQIFLFTCHPAMADMMNEMDMGAQIISLGDAAYTEAAREA